jgi:hypothetical protein
MASISLKSRVCLVIVITGKEIPMKRTRLRQYHKLAVAFWLFQKSLRPEETFDIVEEEQEDEEPDSNRIRCPLCQWQPNAASHWVCADCEEPEYFFHGCGTSWNTFDTRGRCPGCAHQWRWTSCLRCEGWSLHEDWYTKDID